MSRKLPPARMLELDGAQVPTYPGKSCGPCTLCCSLVPVKEIGLAAFHRCQHVRTPPEAQFGCSIYANRPFSCRSWSCSWLSSELPDELRPDRCGVVIDPMPDLIRANGEEVPCAQLWVSRGHEEDWQHNPINAVIRTILEQGMAVLWRLPPGPDGKLLARAFRKDPKTGEYGRSDIIPAAANLSGFSSDGERLHRAQQLLDR